VDGAAHRAALGSGGTTVAVLGTGIDIAYPREHRPLFQEMIAQGSAVVSHLPPGTPGVPQNFKVRNKIIAALSELTVVTRAGEGSGALGTAGASAELGRPVFAVPGDVTCRLACGCNRLLEAGSARAATGLAPIATALGLDPTGWPSAAPQADQARGRGPKARSKRDVRLSARSKPLPPTDVGQALEPVLKALGPEPVQFDDLVERLGLQPSELSARLLELEMLGLCEERFGRTYVRASSAPVCTSP